MSTHKHIYLKANERTELEQLIKSGVHSARVIARARTLLLLDRSQGERRTIQQVIEAAMDCVILHQLNYWDALMIAAAEIARCHKIWTEDLAEGSVIRGVEIVNPLGKKT